MKQEIDKLLQQRFGLSGNINNYTLGTSGQMKTLPATPAATFAITQQPTMLQTSTPPQLPTAQAAPITLPGIAAITPLPNAYQGQTPAAGYPTLPMGQHPPAQTAQKKSSRKLPIIILLLITGSVGTYLFIVQGTKVAAIGVITINGVPIGISDGTTAIDTTLADGTLKTQAAQQLKQNNDDAAISLLNQALGINSNDAEALIYQEDMHVISSGTPYVTLVVGTMLSGSQVQVGRDDLQGAYVAQKEFNDASKLQGGTQVRLLIANTGSQTSTAISNVNRVVQQIIRLQQSDPTFVGVMGWPFSARTQAAIQALSQAHIPMVSQTSSSDSLTNVSRYFLRVVPPNTIQGTQGAKYAEQTLHAKKVALFYDENDPYSKSLAQDFRAQFVVKDQNQVIEEKYTIGDAASIASAIQKVLSQYVDLIYFSGYASDLSTVLSNLPAGNLPVMGGDALYELGGYQSSARANFSRLRFTAFAYPDEWEILGHAAQTPAFFAEYSAAFNPDGQHPGGTYGFTRTDNDVMLSYDATVALLTAYNNALGSGKKNPTPEDENQALHAINGSKVIQGVGGQIAFGSNGDPIDKAIVVLYVDQLGRIHMEPTVLGRFLK
jgi:ABC-type branched-subunit amino acid transport system substrate-binding protein